MNQIYARITGALLVIAGFLIIYKPIIKPTLTSLFHRAGYSPLTTISAVAIIIIGAYLLFRKGDSERGL